MDGAAANGAGFLACVGGEGRWSDVALGLIGMDIVCRFGE